MPLYAQLGGFYALGEGVPFARPAFQVQSVTTGRQNFEDQLNAAGAQGMLRLVPLFFTTGSPQQGNVYFGGTSGETQTFTADVLPGTASLSAFLTQLNERGAQGYRFFGAEVTTPADYTDPLNPVPAEQSHVFVKRTAAPVYAWEAEPRAAGAAAFLSLVNMRGAAGWQWVSTLSAQTNPVPPVPAFHELFLRTGAGTAAFSYSVPASEPTEAAALAQMNALGGDGYRWLGPFDFGTFPQSDRREIYQKSSADACTYRYAAQPATTSAADFLAQANAQGQLGLTFLGPVIFPNDLTVTRNLYIGCTAPAPVLAGSISMDASGTVTFVPAAIFARFQLQTSTDLRSWVSFGEVRSGAVGDTIQWATGVPQSGKRFFRVLGIPRITAG